MVANAREELRILILTPFGKDAVYLQKVLTSESLECVICPDVDSLIGEISRGGGAILTTDEVLSSNEITKLVDVLRAQPPWSALPVLAFYNENNSLTALQKKTQHPLPELTDVTFLQRPVSTASLFSAVKTALRDRGRQYKIRDLLISLEHEIQDKESYGHHQEVERVKSDAASRMKSEFLANMSHEIRTPLGVILGFLDLIKSPASTPDDVAEYISVVDRNSVHLMRIIDDILDLSKVEAGKMEFEEIEFSLGELLFDLSSLTAFKAREKGLLFDMQLKSTVPARIHSDPIRLRQVLTNALGNAIKFTERGRVQLVASFNDNCLQFDITDTGRGITGEQSTKLFQPFTQADSSTTRQFGGTGLGLVLSKRICEEMGGNFVLSHSSAGHGSVFTATFKVRPVPGCKMLGNANFNTPESDVVKRRSEKVLDKMRILLVEDSPDNQALIKILLGKLGAEIDVASNGREGTELALQNEYDAILMDIQMPYMDGHEATRVLRAKGCAYPIIALTAHAMNEERERTLASGFSDFLTKPIQRENLVQVLMKYRSVIPIGVANSAE